MCLDEMIGLFSSDCSCKGMAKDETPKELYIIDDDKDSIELDSDTNNHQCYENNLQLVTAARKNGVKAFKEAMTIITSPNKKTFDNHIFKVGDEDKYTTYLGDEMITVRLQPHNGYDHLTMELNKLKIMFFTTDNTTNEISIEVYKNYELISTYEATVDHTNNMATYGFENLSDFKKFVFSENNVKNIYHLKYMLPEGFTVKNTKFHCGCSRRKPLYMKYLNIGYTGGDMATNSYNTKYTGGLVLDAGLYCDSFNQICEIIKRNEAVSNVVATTIRFFARLDLATKLVTMSDPTLHTMVLPEVLFGKINYYNKQIDYRIKWLNQKISVMSNCYECDKNIMQKVTSII